VLFFTNKNDSTVRITQTGLYKVFGANGLVGYTDVPQMNGDAILVIKDGSGVSFSR